MGASEPPAGPPGPPQGPGDQPGQGQPIPQYGQGTPPPQYGQPPGAYPYAGQNEPQRGTSVFAVLALIFGIIAIVPLGIVFGIVALTRIPRTHEKGKGLAIAGLILSGLWLVGGGLIVLLALVVGGSDGDRDAAGQVTATTEIDSSKLRVGDCVAEIKEGEVGDIKVQPCSGPNGGKVFAVFDLPSGDFPGLESVQASAEKGCTDRWQQSGEQARDLSDIFYLHPTEDSWSLGDHGVSCLIAPR